jgi:hypothetical protein
MDLIPEELRAQIPQLGETEGEPDPMVWVKLSCEAAGWTGYVIELARHAASLWRDDDTVYFGWVVFWDEALKYFTQSDLEHLPGLVTRDEPFAACRLSEVMAREHGLKPKFPPGQFVSTPGALAACEAAGQSPSELLTRHMQGDWGELDPEDVAANEFALQHGLRLLSVYRLSDGTRLWIITEADRSATTILLPEEY